MHSGSSAGSHVGFGERLTDTLVSGRICPESGSPTVECIANCGRRRCLVSIPDAFISPRLKGLQRDTEYVPLVLPASFADAKAFNNNGIVRDRLLRIKPETDSKTAIKYLSEASMALYLVRSQSGILQSGSTDLIPAYDKVLSGGYDKSLEEELEEVLSGIRESAKDKKSVEAKAQRAKAAFCLLMASKLERLHISI
jgi:hypothetical protein